MSVTLEQLLRSVTSGLDLADVNKTDDLAGKTDDLSVKTDDLSAKIDDLMIKTDDLRLGDLFRLDSLLQAAAELKSIETYVDQIAEVAPSVQGPSGEKLQKAVQKLQTALALAYRSFKAAGRQRASTGTGSSAGRDIHIHLHLGV